MVQKKLDKKTAECMVYKALKVGTGLLILGALWMFKNLGYIEQIFGTLADSIFWPIFVIVCGVLAILKGIVIKSKFKL